MTTLRTAAFAAALSLAAAATACAPGAPAGPVSGPITERADARTTVEVRSRNPASLNVYLEAAGIRYRLGTVRPMQTARFDVPRGAQLVTGSVHLVVDPVGSDEVFVTDRIRVRRGQQIAFTAQNRLPISSYMVLDR